jgi:hypothetical protein
LRSPERIKNRYKVLNKGVYIEGGKMKDWKKDAK